MNQRAKTMRTKFIVSDPAADPVTDLRNCEAAIRAAGWWDSAGLDEHWPITTDEADRLLVLGGEYRLDAGDLSELIDRRILPSPAIGEDGYEWNAHDVITASGVLELRGQYRPTPSRNDVKKHSSQLALEAAREDGFLKDLVASVPGQPRYDVTHLLALLIRHESIEARTKIVSLLKMTLEVDHGVSIP
jgi:hypothetical protein